MGKIGKGGGLFLDMNTSQCCCLLCMNTREKQKKKREKKKTQHFGKLSAHFLKKAFLSHECCCLEMFLPHFFIQNRKSNIKSIQ